MVWTDQKIQQLRDMWGNGYSASDIAKRLGGLTRNAVIGKAHRLKLSGRVSPMRGDHEPAVKTNAMVRVRPAKKTMLRAAPSLPAPPAHAAAAPMKRSTDSVQSASAVAPIRTTERQCRWPHGDPRSQEFKFCGCAAVEGLPYCPDHARVAYQSFGRKNRNQEAAVNTP